MIGADENLAAALACLAVLAVFWVACEYVLAKLAGWMLTRNSKKD